MTTERPACVRRRDKAPYDLAEKACDALGGQLTCINNKEENDFLTAQLTASDDYWIGFHDRHRNHDHAHGRFEWSNSHCSSGYTNWMPPNEPNGMAVDGVSRPGEL